MRTLVLSVAVASFLGLGAFAFVARAQDGADPHARLAQPGPEHEQLARLAGEWDVAITMNVPGQPPVEATARAVAESTLGKRFLEIDTIGSLQGTTIESKLVLGFDRRHERWTSVGFDTVGTHWVTAQGVREADGKLRLRGQDDDPLGVQVYYNELEFVGDDEFTSAVCFSQIGPTKFDPPYRMVEMRYRRRKS